MVILTNKWVTTYSLKKLKNNSTFSRKTIDIKAIKWYNNNVNKKRKR